jgi:hypothetical protein
MVFVPHGSGLDVIQESTNSLVTGSPFALPTGSVTGAVGQSVIDVARNKALIAAREASGCPTPGTCTGLAVFDEAGKTFSPSVIVANDPEGMTLTTRPNFVVDSSLSNPSSELTVVDVAHKVSCALSDSSLALVSDGVSIDPATNIAVVGRIDGNAAVINLNGAKFSSSMTPCSVIESGVPPNSIVVSGVGLGLSGAAVNPATHEAFLANDTSGSLTVLTLPAAAVSQLKPGNVSSVSATLPMDPSGAVWKSLAEPFGVSVASCPGGDFGYAVDTTFDWLVQVDLKQLKANPAAINTGLPLGNCVGTLSLHGCSNGKGVTFFPVLLGLP